jgi:hypothetical protein
MTETIINGVVITPYKQWALNLLKREASGEKLQTVSAEAWREVFCFTKATTAREAMKSIKQQEAA